MTRRMKLGKALKVGWGASLALLAIFIVWRKHVEADETRGREVVSVVEFSGHTYTLYFHRRAGSFNTIRRDGELVFDGRDHPELRACIQEMVVMDSAIHRRCYLPLEKKVVTAPLP